MTLKRENGIAAILAAVPVLVFLALADHLSDTLYTYISGLGGWFVSKKGLAILLWFCGAAQYGICLSLANRARNATGVVSASRIRLIASALFSAVIILLLLFNLA